MDPASLAIIARALEPFFGLLAVAAIPTGILWVLKSHKVRMRELDLEERRMPRGAEARLEDRLRTWAIPAALLGAFIVVATGPGHFLARVFLSMWVHEIRHATTA